MLWDGCQGEHFPGLDESSLNDLLAKLPFVEVVKQTNICWRPIMISQFIP